MESSIATSSSTEDAMEISETTETIDESTPVKRQRLIAEETSQPSSTDNSSSLSASSSSSSSTVPSIPSLSSSSSPPSPSPSPVSSSSSSVPSSSSAPPSVSNDALTDFSWNGRLDGTIVGLYVGSDAANDWFSGAWYPLRYHEAVQIIPEEESSLIEQENKMRTDRENNKLSEYLYRRPPNERESSEEEFRAKYPLWCHRISWIGGSHNNNNKNNEQEEFIPWAHARSLSAFRHAPIRSIRRDKRVLIKDHMVSDDYEGYAFWLGVIIDYDKEAIDKLIEEGVDDEGDGDKIKSSMEEEEEGESLIGKKKSSKKNKEKEKEIIHVKYHNNKWPNAWIPLSLVYVLAVNSTPQQPPLSRFRPVYVLPFKKEEVQQALNINNNNSSSSGGNNKNNNKSSKTKNSNNTTTKTTTPNKSSTKSKK